MFEAKGILFVKYILFKLLSHTGSVPFKTPFDNNSLLGPIKKPAPRRYLSLTLLILFARIYSTCSANIQKTTFRIQALAINSKGTKIWVFFKHREVLILNAICQPLMNIQVTTYGGLPFLSLGSWRWLSLLLHDSSSSAVQCSAVLANMASALAMATDEASTSGNAGRLRIRSRRRGSHWSYNWGGIVVIEDAFHNEVADDMYAWRDCRESYKMT